MKKMVIELMTEIEKEYSVFGYNLQDEENLKAEFNGNDTLEFFTFCSQEGKAFEDGCTEKDINESFFGFDARQQYDYIYTSLNADNCKIINVEILEDLDY